MTKEEWMTPEEYIAMVEQENKNLKENYKVLWILNDEIRRINENLREENRKLKASAKLYRDDCKKLRTENEYLHSLLPEADWYVIEKQMKQRFWNDWEEDVYEE